MTMDYNHCPMLARIEILERGEGVSLGSYPSPCLCPLSPLWGTRYQSSSPEPLRSGQVRAKTPRLDQKTRAGAGLVRAVRAVRAKFIIYTHARARVSPSFYHFLFTIKESALTALTS